MKKIAVMLTVFAFSVPASAIHAQQVGASAQTSTPANAGNTHVSQSADISASASAGRNSAAVDSDAASSTAVQMHPVNGELVGKLDARTAKTGDRVVVKSTETFRTSEGVVIPKGSRLVGHVTDVQAHGNGYQDSHLGIEFDRAELKSGASFRMHAMIQSLAPPANAMAAASMDAGDDVASMGGGHASGGGRVGGGGLLGGASAATSGATGIGSSLGHTVDGSVGATSNLTSSTGSTVGRGLSSTTSATGSIGAHATAVPGVMLQGGITDSTSGILFASKHNVHLDSGTQMTLGIAGAMSR